MLLIVRRSAPWCVLALGLAMFVMASPIAGQDELPDRLTLEEALRLARQNNPGYLAQRNDADVADWNVRSAYGSWAPSLSASSSVSWQGPGEQRFGSLTAEQLGFAGQPSYYFSSYNLGVSYTVNGETFFAPGRAKAERQATDARIRTGEANLTQMVTNAYLEVLRQNEQLQLARQRLARAETNLRLATVQRDVGSATELDVRQAEVEVGRATVEILRAENAEHTARLALQRQVGVTGDPSPTSLTTEFVLVEPEWTEEELYVEAIRSNPQLAQLQASGRAAEAGVRAARSAYFPSLSIQAGIGGFTREASDPSSLIAQRRLQAQGQVEQCEALNELVTRLADPLPQQDCSVFSLTDEDVASIVSSNNTFPFDFTKQPAQASLSVSIPIFQGLQRQRDLEAARVQEEDLRYQVREQELILRADIGSGLAAVRTAYETALIEEQNQLVADEQLRLAREQYSVGQVSFIELSEAETVKAEADQAVIAAIFEYHDALANLEAIVGRPLREE